jgi:RNA polymerase sigma-70 factor (ECF subfamily)
MSTLLLAQAQAGDERAFRAVVGPYRRALEVHCYRMLGSIHDAEDVAQDTLLRAWRAFSRFERRSSVETWLYRIATNACLDELEKRPRREVEPYPDSRLEDADTSIADPAARYALHEGMELAFLTAIQRLPGRQRAVLILRDLLAWSAEEVADLLESSPAAVNSALQRARATIEAEKRRAVAPGAGQRDLLRRYVDAWAEADIDGLVELLREDAVLTMPPEASIHGAAAIGEFFTERHPGGAPSAVWANGRPAVLLRGHRLLVLHVDGDRIAEIEVHADPAVLAAFEGA